MQIWKGFKTSAYKYANRCTLVIDNHYKFMSMKTCYDMINEIYDDLEEHGGALSEHKFNQIFQHNCRQKFIKSSIIANYGSRKTYIVEDI